MPFKMESGKKSKKKFRESCVTVPLRDIWTVTPRDIWRPRDIKRLRDLFGVNVFRCSIFDTEIYTV